MRPDGMGALEQRANLTINTNESKFIYLHNRFNQTINMKHIKVLTFFLLLLALIPLAYSNTFPSLTAEFCDCCTTTEAAQQKAWSLSPPVHCDWPGGYAVCPIPPEVSCRSDDRQVILINPQTQAVYSYQLVFDSDSNSHLIQEWPLSSDLSAAVSTIQAIYQPLLGFDFSHTVQGNEGTTFGSVIQSDGTECPQGTALDHYLNPGMREWMIDEMRQNWAQVLNAFSQSEPRVSRSIGIGASAGPVRLTVGWDSSAGAPVDEVFRAGFVFDESEVSTSPPFRDMPVFDIHEFYQNGLNISMDVEFNEGLSRVAGQPVNILFSGQATIDSPCVLQKLEEYQQLRPDIEFREGGPGGPLFEFPQGDHPLDDYCSKLLCARTCVDGDCSPCQFTVTVLVACF